MPFPFALVGLIPNLLGYWQKKQEMQLRWWELIFSVGKDLVKFVVANIKVICIVLIVAYCLLHYLSLRNQLVKAKEGRATAEKALIAHIEGDAEAARVRDVENEAKRIHGKLQVLALQRSHKNEKVAILTHANKAIDKVKKDAENEKKLTDSKLASAYDGLRLAIQRQADSATFGLSSDERDRLARGNDNATLLERLHEAETDLEVCQEAGAIAASDYNLCYGYVKSEQKRLGVEQ
jgi:hypothetical protein